MARPPATQMRIEKEYSMPLKELLHDLYIKQNRHSSDIAEKLNVSAGAIPFWCRKFGIPVKPRGGRIDYPPEVKKKMVTLYEKGMSSGDIATKIGCSSATVSLTLSENNVDIRSKREGAYRKYHLNADYFKTIDTPEKAYFLGFIAADGCVIVKKGGYTLKVKIQSRDVEILEKLKSSIESNAPISFHSSKGRRKQCSLRIHNADLVEDLIFHGIVPRKTKVLEPPKTIPEDLYCHYIRGIFDGDGCVTQSHKKYSHIKIGFCGTPRLMEWIAEVLWDKLHLSKNKVCLREEYFASLSYSCSRALKIRDFMYPTGKEFGLSRKKAKLFSI